MPLLLTDDLKKRLYAHHQYDENKYDIEVSGEETYRFVPKAQASIQPPAPDETTAQLGAANLKPSAPSAWESFGRASATSVIPTAAGILTAAGAASMMAPEPTITKLIGLGLLGAGASMGASKLQSEVVPQSIQEKLFTRPQDVQENPIATAAGGFVPTALAFKPSIADIKTLGQGARNMSWAAQGARGALTPEQAAALANAGVNLGVAGGMEGYELMEGKPFNPLESAINVLPGALFTRPNALGQRLGFGNTEVNKAPVIPDEPAPSKPTIPESQKVPARMSGQTGEGVVISEGQVIPVGSTKLKEPDLTGEVRGKDPYQAMSGNTDDTIVGTPRPTKSAVDSAVAMESASVEAKKKVDYETSLREKAKQDAEEVYRKAFEEAAQGKLVGSTVARPEQSVKPLATTETGKEILPDYTGVQEADVVANKTTPKTEAEWVQEQFDRLDDTRRKYQPDQEAEALSQQDKLLADIEAEATRRQLKVRYVPEINIAGQKKRGYYDPKTREVVISKSKATQDTPSHEVGHGYVDDLLASPNTKDHDFVLRGLEFADDQGRKFRTKQDWEALTPEERSAIDERFVQLLGEEGAKQRKAELYGTKRQQFSKWLENVGSNVKNKLGVGDATDRARSVSVSQRHDLRSLKPTEEAGTKLPATPIKGQDLSDYEQYQEVQRKFKELMLQGKGMGDPEIQALWKENEVIKNRHGGMPPKAPESGSDGKKFQDDDSRDTFELSLNKELRASKPFGLTPDKEGKLAGNYVADKLPKVLPKLEHDMLKEAGIEKFLRYGKHTPAEIEAWVKENGPRVQTHSYGMERKVSEAQKEYDRLQHAFYDTLSQKAQSQIQGIKNNFEFPSIQEKIKEELLRENPHIVEAHLDNYLAAWTKFIGEGRSKTERGPRATSAYETVSPFPVNEPMPEWTKSKEGKNVQRVDVVLPQQMQKTVAEQAKENAEYQRALNAISDPDIPNAIGSVRPQPVHEPMWRQDNLHENLPNTLGWAMIQYKTGAKGEKIAVIAEAQSRWGQEHRKNVEAAKELAARSGSGYQYGGLKNKLDHPLLRDYNRLILKAAIEQARKEGATHIMVSDAETAMMTEGHDLNSKIVWNEGKHTIPELEGKEYPTSDGKKLTLTGRVEIHNQKNSVGGGQTAMLETTSVIPANKWIESTELHISNNEANRLTSLIPHTREVSQEPGMRLNYDSILPKIAEELTGSKGERVSLGEHKNVLSDFARSAYGQDMSLYSAEQKYRSNLIFKNPDGSPKTDVSGQLFPIDSVASKLSTEPFSLTGRKFQGEETKNEPLLLPSRFDKVARLGKTGKEVSEKLKNFQSESEFLQGKYGNKVIAALRGYDEIEIANVYKYRHAISNGLPTDGMKLTANEQKLKSALDSEFKAIGEDIIASGLEVKDSEDFRKMQLKPEGYQPNIVAQKVIDAWQENTADAANYDKLYIDHMLKQGLSKEEADLQLKEYKQAVGNAGVTPDVRFNAIRKAEGMGLPFELVEQNPALAFRRYGRRAANDVAYFKYLQNDPRMLKALGIRDQKGQSIDELPTDIQDQAKDVDWVGGSEEVKNALRSVYGIDTPMNQRGNAAIRAIANSVIQTGAAIRNIVGLPTSYAGYYGVGPKTLVEAITKMSERSARAFESNAVRSSFKDFDAAGIIEGHPDRFVELADKYSNFMRKWTGRDLSDKFEGELSYSLGETLAVNWLAQAKAGDIKARRMLNRFGGNVEGGIKEKFLPKSEVTQDDISRIAKNFVDATRGSYGPSGLPSSAIEGGAAPMLSLARWSIEKFNTFQKDVVRPITEHNDWMPLLKTTFAGLLTGAAIEKLNELLSQKKGADATIEETWADGDIDAITHKVIGLLQLGGFAGILSDTMKATSAWSQGKDLAFSNPISMPALTLAEEVFQNSGYAFEAAQQGEDKLEVLSKFLGDILKTTYQNVRYANNWMDKEETERKGKFRDLRVFRELEGKPPGDASASNPYLGMAAREFKRAEDIETAASKLPRALETAVKKSKGNYEDLVGNVEGLRKNSYQTFPADPMEASKYYQYLVKTIGVERANMRYADYLRQQEVNKQKTKMVPKLKSMFSRD